jgi:hypothetical protein
MLVLKHTYIGLKTLKFPKEGINNLSIYLNADN